MTRGRHVAAHVAAEAAAAADGKLDIGRASGVSVGDVTSGFRAFSREAAMQINVFKPVYVHPGTVIQAGNRNSVCRASS